MSDQAEADALDALEALLHRQRAYLEGRGPLPDAPWDAPEGRLPESQRTRALVLAAECDEIERELQRLLRARSDRPVTSPYR